MGQRVKCGQADIGIDANGHAHVCLTATFFKVSRVMNIGHEKKKKTKQHERLERRPTMREPV